MVSWRPWGGLRLAPLVSVSAGQAGGIPRLALGRIAPVAAGRSSGSFWLVTRDVHSLPRGLLIAGPFALVQQAGCEPESEQKAFTVPLQLLSE